MAHYISIKDKNDNTQCKHFKVDEEVYIYIRQLETYIKHPKQSKLLEVYKDRFNRV